MLTPPSSLRGFVSLTALLLAPFGCSGGDTGTDGRLSPVDMVIRGCDPGCANGEARQSCLARDCADVMAHCFGGSYPSGDYTGGVCESDLECLARFVMVCDAECVPTPTCRDCVENALNGCGETSDCPRLECPR